MIGEGYGYMKELAETMRDVQVALITANMTGNTQQGDIFADEKSITISFK